MKQSKRNQANAKAKEEKRNGTEKVSRYAQKGPSYDYSEMYERKPRPKSNRG